MVIDDLELPKNPPVRSKTLQVRVPYFLYDRIKVAAFNRNLNVSQFIRKLLDENIFLFDNEPNF